MTRRIMINNKSFNKIRKIKSDYIKKKMKDRRCTKCRVTDAYIVDMILKKW